MHANAQQDGEVRGAYSSSGPFLSPREGGISAPFIASFVLSRVPPAFLPRALVSVCVGFDLSGTVRQAACPRAYTE